MSTIVSEDVTLLTKQLIEKILGLTDGTETFRRAEKSAVTRIKCSDSLFYSSEKEIDRIIDSLCRKFELHGFLAQAKDLQRHYDKLVPPMLPKQERLTRMNIIKFLLDVSDSPTNNIYKYLQQYEKKQEEDIIDWPKYLTEDIPRWSPPPDDDSDGWSDESESSTFIVTRDITDDGSKFESRTIIDHKEQHDFLATYSSSKASLISSVQSKWFNHDRVRFKPTSEDSVANVALLWDNFVEHTTKGLIPVRDSNIISEYKIMREVIWQLYEPHSSSCFKFMGNALVLKANVTIASVRMEAFESFLYEFVPYIDWLQILREFHESLNVRHDDGVVVPPDTYKSYDFALQTIVNPIFDVLKTMEDKIKAQDTITTLLTLAHEIRPFFRTVRILKDIHCNVILDFRTNSPLHCATTLLARLHKGLRYASSKLEQDLYLTLYLHSLYKYFTIVNSWLGRDVLEDYTGEFVIADENPKDVHVLFKQSLVSAIIPKETRNATVCFTGRKAQKGEQDWQMEFAVKNLDGNAKCDGLIDHMCRQVLQIGKNIHLLRLLGKLHLVPEFTGTYKETIYTAYIERILKNIAVYFDVNDEIDEAVQECEPDSPPLSPTFVFPATCPDECKYLTEMDRLENLVDTSDGFLVKAFESFFIKKPDVKEAVVEDTLFERVSKLTKGLFPVQEMMELVFVDLLKERFSVSGLMVKNVLINEYSLVKQFSFLKNVFLFEDDLIFPLYRRIFQQLDSNGMWGNHTWLTSHLQDVIMDAYPNLYKECSVEVKDNWKLCTDPLKACRMVNVHYRIRWPVNIIIRDEHMALYRELFQFILTIKWALYTLNHLYFTELEPKGTSVKHQPKSVRKLITKLKILRFELINIFSNIQHYILGHIFHKYSYKFDKSFENAYDLESLVNAHGGFIKSLHKACSDFQDYNSSSYGFYLLLYLVHKLRIMWRNLCEINDEELEKCELSYRICYKKIDPIINPAGYHAFVSDE